MYELAAGTSKNEPKIWEVQNSKTCYSNCTVHKNGNSVEQEQHMWDDFIQQQQNKQMEVKNFMLTLRITHNIIPVRLEVLMVVTIKNYWLLRCYVV